MSGKAGGPLRQDMRAWMKGYLAGATGRRSGDCPYRAGTTEAWSWCSGFVEGQVVAVAGFDPHPLECPAAFIS